MMRAGLAARSHRALLRDGVRQDGGADRAQPRMRPGARRRADDLPEHRRARLQRRRRWCVQAAEALHARAAARSTPRPPACRRCASASRAGTARASAWTSTAQRIVVTAGASAALQLACLALFEAGDEVLMPDPSYPCNRHFVAAAGATARLLPAIARGALPARCRRRARALERTHARRAAGLAVQPHRHLDRARRDGGASSRRCARAAASRWSTRSTWA